ncbi:MAG: hypothetical protein KDA84_05890 [Planctomycetaceae bacterium]|nr:hypothetical protein [Planctomycetaceae bacterium]
MSKIRSVQSERANLQMEFAQRKNQLEGSLATLTPEDVRKMLTEFQQLLEDGAADQLGEESVRKAVGCLAD